jgi:hypothetical protein
MFFVYFKWRLRTARDTWAGKKSQIIDIFKKDYVSATNLSVNSHIMQFGLGGGVV